MRIAITDDYQDVMSGLDCMKLLDGHEVTIVSGYVHGEDALVAALNDPEAIVLNRTRTHITASLLSKLPSLKFLSQTGKNAGHIDVEACKRYGVTLLEGKGNPIATAELTWLLIMNGLRLLPQAMMAMKDGAWQTNLGRRVHGKKIGIWSYGRIGKLVANYARAFSADVMIWGSDASCKRAREDGFQIAKSKTDLFATCDVVTIHIRLAPATRGIVKEQDLSQMKKDALLVNTSRAELIELDALVKCLKNGRPGYAALDVFYEEPITRPDHPLLLMPNVLCTPHLGYVEKESYELYYSIAFQNLMDAIENMV